MDSQFIPEGKDPALWRIAQKRASFKRHLTAYVVINIFLWIIWFFTNETYGVDNSSLPFPWPLWTMFGWGIGLVFHYLSAYVNTDQNPVGKEYDKLIQTKSKI